MLWTILEIFAAALVPFIFLSLSGLPSRTEKARWGKDFDVQNAAQWSSSSSCSRRAQRPGGGSDQRARAIRFHVFPARFATTTPESNVPTT